MADNANADNRRQKVDDHQSSELPTLATGSTPANRLMVNRQRSPMGLSRRTSPLVTRRKGSAESSTGAAPLTVSWIKSTLSRLQRAYDRTSVLWPHSAPTRGHRTQRFGRSVAANASQVRLIALQRSPVDASGAHLGSAWDAVEMALPTAPEAPASSPVAGEFRVGSRIPKIQGPSIFSLPGPAASSPSPAQRRPAPAARPHRGQPKLAPKSRLFSRVDEGQRSSPTDIPPQTPSTAEAALVHEDKGAAEEPQSQPEPHTQRRTSSPLSRKGLPQEQEPSSADKTYKPPAPAPASVDHPVARSVQRMPQMDKPKSPRVSSPAGRSELRAQKKRTSLPPKQAIDRTEPAQESEPAVDDTPPTQAALPPKAQSIDDGGVDLREPKAAERGTTSLPEKVSSAPQTMSHPPIQRQEHVTEDLPLPAQTREVRRPVEDLPVPEVQQTAPSEESVQRTESQPKTVTSEEARPKAADRLDVSITPETKPPTVDGDRQEISASRPAARHKHPSGTPEMEKPAAPKAAENAPLDLPVRRAYPQSQVQRKEAAVEERPSIEPTLPSSPPTEKEKHSQLPSDTEAPVSRPVQQSAPPSVPQAGKARPRVTSALPEAPQVRRMAAQESPGRNIEKGIASPESRLESAKPLPGAGEERTARAAVASAAKLPLILRRKPTLSHSSQRKSDSPAPSAVRRPTIGQGSPTGREAPSAQWKLISHPVAPRSVVKESPLLNRPSPGLRADASSTGQPAPAPPTVEQLLATLAGQSAADNDSGGLLRSSSMALPVWPVPRRRTMGAGIETPTLNSAMSAKDDMPLPSPPAKPSPESRSEPSARPTVAQSIQRQSTPAVTAVSQPVASTIVQRAEVDDAGEPEEMDLADLAKQVYPLIKRMLLIDRERTSKGLR